MSEKSSSTEFKLQDGNIPPFHLEELSLKNYRCFPEVDLSFHPRLTVFVAPNGGGKTAILDGVAASLRLFVDTMERRTASKGFDPQDIRRVTSPTGTMELCLPVWMEGKASFWGQDISWERDLKGAKEGSTQARTTTAGAKQLKDFALSLIAENDRWISGDGLAPTFPVIAYYGTGRLWGASRMTDGKKTSGITPNARFRGYGDCLSPSSHYKGFVDWLSRFSLESLSESMSSKKSPHFPKEALAAVAQVVDRVLAPTGWGGLEWDFVEKTPRVSNDKLGTLPVDSLSDGIRTMIGLVADIAYRCTVLNPHLGRSSVEGTPGIVLIDEVDMHLHPGWQQMVILSLQEAFPMVQFIVTTHSPQVLSTVDKESIRVIEIGHGGVALKTPSYQTKGVESTDVLCRIMDIDPAPSIPEAELLSEYRAIIEEGDWEGDRAKRLRQSLVAHFGQKHPVMVDCDRLIRFQRVKRRSGI